MKFVLIKLHFFPSQWILWFVSILKHLKTFAVVTKCILWDKVKTLPHFCGNFSYSDSISNVIPSKISSSHGKELMCSNFLKKILLNQFEYRMKTSRFETLQLCTKWSNALGLLTCIVIPSLLLFTKIHKIKITKSALSTSIQTT